MKYLSDVIGEAYQDWGPRKIILSAPTGAGKTTFILKELLPYYKKNGWKLLILCNRRMLEEQYDASLATMYETFLEYDNVEIQSYQHFAHADEAEIARVQREYYGICFDECHYFVQDSDFNQETYGLWQVITKRFYSKQMIFISATIECMRPFIDQFKLDIEATTSMTLIQDTYKQFIDDGRYDIQPDYSYLDLIGVPNKQDLCKRIAADEGKALIFINDKEGAKKLKEMLLQCGLEKNEVRILNADELSRQDDLKDTLVYGGCLPENTKVLITTSVLDNGVSLVDENITSVTVFTISKTDFVQMIGRVRKAQGSNRRIRLYLVKRYYQELRSRKEELKIASDVIRTYETDVAAFMGISPLLVSNNSREAEVARKISYYVGTGKRMVYTRSGYRRTTDITVSLNLMAVHKIKGLYHDVVAAYTECIKNPKYVPELQASWVGYAPEDIIWEEGDAISDEIKMYIMSEMSKEVGKDKFSEIRENVAKLLAEYGRHKKYDARGDRSMSQEKFDEVCADLKLTCVKTKKSGKMCYRVQRKDEEE